MKLKTLIAAAVAGAFALPLTVHAQGSAGGAGDSSSAGGGSGYNAPSVPATTAPANTNATPGSVKSGEGRAGSASAGATGSFSTLDTNRDGHVSREEARAWRDNSRFSELDKDGDGRISQAEWDSHNRAGAGGTSINTPPGAGRGMGDNAQTPGNPNSTQLPSRDGTK